MHTFSEMWLCVGLLLTLLAPSGMWVQGDATPQVLITHRGVPAPFPHYPIVNVVDTPTPSEEEERSQPDFEFAPTPTGKAAPVGVTEPPSFLVPTPAVPEDVSQNLGIISFYFLLQTLYSLSKVSPFSLHFLVHFYL